MHLIDRILPFACQNQVFEQPRLDYESALCDVILDKRFVLKRIFFLAHSLPCVI